MIKIMLLTSFLSLNLNVLHQICPLSWIQPLLAQLSECPLAATVRTARGSCCYRPAADRRVLPVSAHDLV